MSTYGLGQGEEYELRAAAHVITDEKVRKWRAEQFEAAGFSADEAARLASRADVDLHKVIEWIGQGATHAQVLAIVAPDDAVEL